MGRIGGRCLELFGRIRVHEAFRVERLSLMIRATSSRSTERQRDRESRPNHMLSLRDSLQTLISVDLRRLARRFHSIAKQASLSVAFRSDFEGFGNDFGTLWEAKMDANIDFWEVILQCLFRMCFFIDLGSFLRPQKSEKS